VGDLLEAAMLIRKRNDESSLKLAALLADKAGALDLASMLANQSLKQSLLVEKWDIANEVALQHAHLKVKTLKLCSKSASTVQVYSSFISNNREVTEPILVILFLNDHYFMKLVYVVVITKLRLCMVICTNVIILKMVIKFCIS
jgi:hypothetical protein